MNVLELEENGWFALIEYSIALTPLLRGWLTCLAKIIFLVFLVSSSSVVLTALVVIPNWPVFNRHPLTWLDSFEADGHSKPVREASNLKKKPLEQK